MNHVAIDLGSRKSQYCVRAADGQVLEEGKVATKELGALFRRIPKSRVVLETCSEAFTVADLAKEAGHEVSAVPATLAPSLGVGQRGVKNDVRDAQNLSLASCRMGSLPGVHLPSPEARNRRAMLSARAVLISTRTSLINTVSGWARTQLLTIPSGKSSTFPMRARQAFEAEPSGYPEYIERILKALEAVIEQIEAADKELADLADQDETCRRLMTVPGVGPVTSMGFRAVVDDVSRFKSAHALESYLGMTPGESSSGMSVHRLGITRAGSVRMRANLVQAAWTAWRTRPNDPMVLWAKKLADRRPKQVAVVALARKMSGILFALWRNGTTYNPAHQR